MTNPYDVAKAMQNSSANSAGMGGLNSGLGGLGLFGQPIGQPYPNQWNSTGTGPVGTIGHMWAPATSPKDMDWIQERTTLMASLAAAHLRSSQLEAEVARLKKELSERPIELKELDI